MSDNKIKVNADDFGYSTDVNLGILKAFQLGKISQTTLMVNMTACEEAVKLAKESGVWGKVGLHLNLTEGYPITDEIKNTAFCKHGMFCNNVHAITRNRKLTPAEKEALSAEIFAQIEKFKSFAPSMKHMDSHHHVHVEIPILELIIKFEANFESMRLSRNLMGFDLRSLLKRVPKYYINGIISKHFVHTRYFGNYNDFCKYWDHKSSVEVEVHPILKDGQLLDLAGIQVNDMLKYPFCL